MDLPHSTNEAIIWLFSGIISILIIFFGIIVKILYARILSWNTNIDDVRLSIMKITSSLDNQKNWGHDLNELKITTNLILETNEYHKLKVSNLEEESKSLRDRYQVIFEKVNEIVGFIELIRISGCRQDCPVANSVEFHKNKVKNIKI
ncbi:MAG: hypothetical protein RLY43_1320 [Bacteroidota bacterium]|jgi:hypothetical protein